MIVKKIFGFVFFFVLVSTTIIWSQTTGRSTNYEFFTKNISDQEKVSEFIVSGSVHAGLEIENYFGCEGVITHISVINGEKVKKGDLLAKANCPKIKSLSNDEMSKLVTDLKIKDEYKHKISSIEELQKSGFYSEVEALEEKMKIINAMSKITKIEEDYKKTQREQGSQYIYAKADGIVTSINSREGQKTSGLRDKAPIMTFMPENSEYKVDLEIQDYIINDVHKGQMVKVHLPGNYSEEFIGVITNINKRETEALKKRFFIATVTLEQSSMHKALFKSGMKVEAVVTSKQNEELIWIPRSAIEIDIPERLVSEELNYANTNSVKTRLGKNDKFDKNADQGVVGRSVASTLKDDISREREIYVQMKSKKIVKIKINIEKITKDFIGIRNRDIINQNVITHYETKKNWLRELDI